MTSLLFRLRSSISTKIAAGLLITFLIGSHASALPISGSIAFGGNAKLNVPTTQIATATGVTSISYGYVSPNQQFGDFAPIPNFTSASFTAPFSFSDSGITPLWTVTSAGLTYSFTATSITATYYSGFKIWNL